MFPQSHDSYHHFRNIISSLLLPNYTSPSYANTHAFQSRGFNPQHAPAYISKSHQSAPNPHRSAFNIETSDSGEQSNSDHETDAESTQNDRLHISSSYASHREAPDFNPTAQFKRLQVRVPRRTAQDLRASDEVLILPSSLTHLKISVYTNHTSHTIRAAVATDMRLRDVVKQILAQEHLHNARAFVRGTGEWIEPGAQVKVSDVSGLGQFAMNGRKEAEVRVIIGDRRRGARNGEREGVMGRHDEWEREMSWAERKRVY